LVGGTVDSHSRPIATENRYTLHGVNGAVMTATMATARASRAQR
jgi:hypothetical protein